MALAICGTYDQGEEGTSSPALNAMLDALPGLGCCRCFRQGAVTFGCRELRDCADESENGISRSFLSARGLDIIADVRLDNRAELLQLLGVADPEDAYIPDCEILIRAYEHWGEDCPLHVYGDYAFAIWDSRRNQLFCVRDALGIRPFFYSHIPGRIFAFASDIAALLALPEVDDELDEEYVVSYLMAVMQEREATFFREVRTLLPGHVMTVHDGTLHMSRWWHPENVPDVHLDSDEDYERGFVDLYSLSVRHRIRDVPSVGIHLSGGLDSSSVAVLAARELRDSKQQRPHMFCWHPPPGDHLTEAEENEYRLIRSVCRQENLKARYHALSTESILDILERDIVRFPDSSGTLIHESLVQKSAADLGVAVMLSGWGGDEVCSCRGFDYFDELLRIGNLVRLFRETGILSIRTWRILVSAILRLSKHSGAVRYAVAFFRGEMPSLNRSFIDAAMARKYPKRREAAHGRSVRDTQLKRLDQGHLERRMEDWTSSGAKKGIEYRYPLLDRRLIEFVLGLPPEQFRAEKRTRWFFRRSLRSVLPPEILEQSVKTDPVRYLHLNAAMAGALPVIARHLDSRTSDPLRAQYVDMARLRRCMEKRMAGDKSRQEGKMSRALRILDWRTELK
ncbi:MAG: asparagine synthase-related protein [Gammaproteobacteria bacterium]|nr:asparagine synthase-related protein [Gammaproteobacteria bacterium]